MTVGGAWFDFVVHGEPGGKERARVVSGVTKGGKRYTRAYTPAKTASNERNIATIAKLRANMCGWTFTKDDRFEVSVFAWRKHKDKGPDADNILKSVLDALNGVAYVDDRHVRRIRCEIGHAVAPEGPRMSVVVMKWPK